MAGRVDDSIPGADSPRETSLQNKGLVKMSPLDLLERQSRKLAISPKINNTKNQTSNGGKSTDTPKTNQHSNQKENGQYNGYTFSPSAKSSSSTAESVLRNGDTIKVVQYAAPPLRQHVIEDTREWTPSARTSTTSLHSTSTASLGGNILDGLRLSSLPGYDPDAVSLYSVDTVESYTPEQSSSRVQPTYKPQEERALPPQRQSQLQNQNQSTGDSSFLGSSADAPGSRTQYPRQVVYQYQEDPNDYYENEENRDGKTPTQESYNESYANDSGSDDRVKDLPKKILFNDNGQHYRSDSQDSHSSVNSYYNDTYSSNVSKSRGSQIQPQAPSHTRDMSADSTTSSFNSSYYPSKDYRKSMPVPRSSVHSNTPVDVHRSNSTQHQNHHTVPAFVNSPFNSSSNSSKRFSVESSQSGSSLSTGSPSIRSFQSSLSGRGPSPHRGQGIGIARSRSPGHGHELHNMRSPRRQSPQRMPQNTSYATKQSYFFPTSPQNQSRSPAPAALASVPLLSKRGSSPIRNQPSPQTPQTSQTSPKQSNHRITPGTPPRHSANLHTSKSYAINARSPEHTRSPQPQSQSPSTPNSRMTTGLGPRLTRNVSNSSTLSRSPANSNDEDDEKPLSEMSLEEHVSKGIEAHEAGNLRESSYHWQYAANKGDPTAQLLYGLALRHGWGVRQNAEEAVTWLRRAMESSLGEDFHSNDFGDTAKRISQMATASDQKSKINRAHVALALYELGMSYLHSWGLEKDENKALAAFEAAGELDDADALCEAAALYMHNGHKRKKDLQKAAKLYRRAGELGASMVGESWIYKDKYLSAEEKKKAKAKGKK